MLDCVSWGGNIDMPVCPRTSSFDCSLDVTETSDDNIILSQQARGWRHGTCGMTGVVFPNFAGGANAVPKKPWPNTKTYQAIKGIMQLSSKSPNLLLSHISCHSHSGFTHVLSPSLQFHFLLVLLLSLQFHFLLVLLLSLQFHPFLVLLLSLQFHSLLVMSPSITVISVSSFLCPLTICHCHFSFILSLSCHVASVF